MRPKLNCTSIKRKQRFNFSKIFALNKKNFAQNSISILLAQAHAANKDEANARAEFVYAISTFDSAESRAQYALWAANIGDLHTAKNLRVVLEKDWQHWNKHTRYIHKALFDALDAAIAVVKA